MKTPIIKQLPMMAVCGTSIWHHVNILEGWRDEEVSHGQEVLVFHMTVEW